MPSDTAPVDPPKPLPGRLGNLTVVQQHALEKFKKELQQEEWFDPERHDDATLLRFLRARKFDVAKAKEMIIACENWRKEFGVDGIQDTFDYTEKADVDKYYPQYYHKMDKDGRPVYIERLGKLNIKALYSITTQDRQIRHLVQEYEKFLLERLPACSAKMGYHVETSCTIMDLHNVGLGQFYSVKEYVMRAAKIGQDYYPECMGKFYLINAPFMFSTVWMIIKPWLDPVTVSKIDILSNNYKDKLLEQIPIENLPKDLGGTCQCSGGCSLGDEGPWTEMSKEEVSAALKKIRSGGFAEEARVTMEEEKVREAEAAAAT